MTRASIRVLVFEDKPDIADLMVRLLHHLGYDASHEKSVNRAIERLMQERFSILVADIFYGSRLTESSKTGLLLIRKVKLRSVSPAFKSRGIGIVATSGAVIDAQGNDVEEEAMKAGAALFASKPISAKRLSELLQSVLSERAASEIDN
ncbi:MAG: hypothetical protein AAGF33_17705 [Pseudomonadota bacterium]